MGLKEFLWGVAETAIDVGASFIPGGSLAKKMAKKSMKGLARATGMAKDLFSGGGGGFSSLADKFGDLQKKHWQKNEWYRNYIAGQSFTKLEISPEYEQKNKEFKKV